MLGGDFDFCDYTGSKAACFSNSANDENSGAFWVYGSARVDRKVISRVLSLPLKGYFMWWQDVEKALEALEEEGRSSDSPIGNESGRPVSLFHAYGIIPEAEQPASV